MVTKQSELPIAVIGAGPVGLAAAVHLLERGLRPLILEAASDVAHSVRQWGHVRLFSPWRYNVDKAAARLLERAGWTAPPPEELPTGEQLYRSYLRPLSELGAIRDNLRVGQRVAGISRAGLGKVSATGRAEVPFLIRTVNETGGQEDFIAGAVIDASGTWQNANPLGAAGLPAIGESSLQDRICYGIPDVLERDRSSYIDKTTLVVGAGHSAANSILALAQLAHQNPATTILWATRGGNLSRVFGGGDRDGLPARGKLGAELRKLVDGGRLTMIDNFRIESLRDEGGKVAVLGVRGGGPFTVGGLDAIVAATGQRPDLAINRELRLSVDSALECVTELGPLIDPNEHSCGTVRPHGAKELAHPEPNFYIIGSKSYGRAPTFLLATGYEQARSVAAMLAGDRQAALRVELELPETGVCNADIAADGGGCCSPSGGGCC